MENRMDQEDVQVDAIDRNILRILCLYEHLSLLQLWYELGEGNPMKKRLTKEEISSRLESLKVQGVVKRIIEGEDSIRWALKRGQIKR
jgi:DNA-binding Lrp family transcriptional regulator